MYIVKSQIFCIFAPVFKSYITQDIIMKKITVLSLIAIFAMQLMATQLVITPHSGAQLAQDIAAIGKWVFVGADLQLIDKYRGEWLKSYKTYKNFSRKFDINEAIMKQLIDEAQKMGIEYHEEQFRQSESQIKLQMKALIARDLWSNNEYYQTINAANESVTKAVELLEKESSPSFPL